MADARPIPNERRCWAGAVSACDGGGLSREHIIPRGMLRVPRVELHGVAPKVVERHIDDVVVKALCERHNQELSPLDQAATDVANAMRAYVVETAKRIDLKRTEHALLEYVVDGRRFERAMLKIAVNTGVALRRWPRGNVPPKALVEMVFGLRYIPVGAGLGALDFRRGGPLVFNESFEPALVADSEKHSPFALVMELFEGFSLACTWTRELRGLHRFVEFKGRQIIVPLAAIDNSKENVRVTFDHSGHWPGPDANTVIELRKRVPKIPRK